MSPQDPTQPFARAPLDGELSGDSLDGDNFGAQATDPGVVDPREEPQTTPPGVPTPGDPQSQIQNPRQRLRQQTAREAGVPPGAVDVQSRTVGVRPIGAQNTGAVGTQPVLAAPAGTQVIETEASPEDQLRARGELPSEAIEERRDVAGEAIRDVQDEARERAEDAIPGTEAVSEARDEGEGLIESVRGGVRELIEDPRETLAERTERAERINEDLNTGLGPVASGVGPGGAARGAARGVGALDEALAALRGTSRAQKGAAGVAGAGAAAATASELGDGDSEPLRRPDPVRETRIIAPDSEGEFPTEQERPEDIGEGTGPELPTPDEPGADPGPEIRQTEDPDAFGGPEIQDLDGEDTDPFVAEVGATLRGQQRRRQRQEELDEPLDDTLEDGDALRDGEVPEDDFEFRELGKVPARRQALQRDEVVTPRQERQRRQERGDPFVSTGPETGTAEPDEGGDIADADPLDVSEPGAQTSTATGAQPPGDGVLGGDLLGRGDTGGRTPRLSETPSERGGLLDPTEAGEDTATGILPDTGLREGVGGTLDDLAGTDTDTRADARTEAIPDLSGEAEGTVNLTEEPTEDPTERPTETPTRTQARDRNRPRRLPDLDGEDDEDEEMGFGVDSKRWQNLLTPPGEIE